MLMKITVAVADEIRAELARRRKSQADLADALHMTQAAISRRLSGTTPITIDEFFQICHWLGIEPGQMLDQIDVAVDVATPEPESEDATA